LSLAQLAQAGENAREGDCGQGAMARVMTTRGLGPVALAASLLGGYVASVLFSFFMSRLGGHDATLWTANGFLAGALILLQGRWRIGVAALCLASKAAISLAIGDHPARALLNPVINLLEAGLAAWLAVTFCGATSRRLSLRNLTLLLVGAIAPAALFGGVLGAVSNALSQGQPLIEGWLGWAVSGGLGLVIVLPALLLVTKVRQYRDFDRSSLEVAALLVALSGLTGAVFYQDDLPLQFIIFPTLTLVAFRLGPPGAAVGGFLVAIISLPLVMTGHGPAMLSPVLDPASRIQLTEVVVAAAVFTGVVSAAALADQLRLKRLMIARDRAARAARVRAREAERLAAEALETAALSARRAGVHRLA
jgi:integral membrane sensor domain MASE1